MSEDTCKVIPSPSSMSALAQATSKKILSEVIEVVVADQGNVVSIRAKT